MISPSLNRKMVGPWNLKELASPAKDAPKVFSTFSCGGGSSMGYKLAGFNLLGCLEIDPIYIDAYKRNLDPKYAFNQKIQDFKNSDEIPDELFDLDILDGSPPCATFSMAGNREKDWGKTKKYSTGNINQRIDDLFFHYIDLAERLKPKVVVAENVSGLLMGNAKGYVKEINEKFKAIGYNTQLFLLDSSFMGVPQRRRRVFFISRRADLAYNPVKMSFNEPFIRVRDAWKGLVAQKSKELTPGVKKWWLRTPRGQYLSYAHPKGSLFNWHRLSWNEVSPTVMAFEDITHPEEPRHLSALENGRIQTFPDDYNFANTKPGNLCGRSVPPYMMARIALSIKDILK